jgi:hypothetical protein
MPKGRFEVIEVDARGRPRRVLRQDVVTGEMGEEEWAEGRGPLTAPEENVHLRGVDAQNRPIAAGYSARGVGAVSDYNPVSRMEKERER